MSIEAALLTDIGRRRAQNQDSGGSFPEMNLFVVADGMGGHRGGEVASRMAVDTIHEVMTSSLKAGRTPAEALELAAKAANAKIMERSKKEEELEGMGTTATTLYFDLAKSDNGAKSRALVGHVGDSRCYLLRPDGIWQITRDHALVQEKLRAGMITRDQLKTDRMKNVITRSVGFDLQFGIDLYEYEPAEGDLFLICSDGLTGPLEDAMIYDIACEIFFDVIEEEKADGTPCAFGAHLAKLAEALVRAANDRGGDDNITALVARYSGDTK
ncbi:MAG: serine/threonine-protein phosphatase [Cryobacterium sp.]|nr:serine/threonine-protein phosphatase [Oligoflexia bacterium]